MSDIEFEQYFNNNIHESIKAYNNVSDYFRRYVYKCASIKSRMQVYDNVIDNAIMYKLGLRDTYTLSGNENVDNVLEHLIYSSIPNHLLSKYVTELNSNTYIDTSFKNELIKGIKHSKYTHLEQRYHYMTQQQI